MDIKLVEIDDYNFSSVVRLYEEKEFFFKTKRPESLFEGNIRDLVLSDDDNKTFYIYCNDNLQGLISIEEDNIEENSIFINLRLKNMNLILDDIESFHNVLLNFSRKYEIIKMNIFDFDEIGKEVCKKLMFSIEAILKNHVYKNNKYNDLIIYSKKTDRW